MKIKVTLGHIAKSVEFTRQCRLRTQSCPIAIALKEATGKTISVSAVAMSYGNKIAFLSSAAMDFVQTADAGYQQNRVNPAEFDLDVESLL